jgi:hypothetical protein
MQTLAQFDKELDGFLAPPHFSNMRAAVTILYLGMLATSMGQTIQLANGKSVQVTSAKAEPLGARIVFQDQERLVAWAEITAVIWPPLPEETAAIEAVKKGAPLVKVIDLWGQKRPWLQHPRSNAGDFGLAYAAELAKRTLPDDLARARELYVEIATQDWSPERREMATVERMRLDLRAGKLAEVQQEILELPATASAGLLMETHLTLAQAQWQALEALIKEHPKWQEEDEIVPRHTALCQAIQDNFYYPVLFHGSDESRGRRSLAELAKFYTFLGQPKQAQAAQADLQRLYPTPAGKEAP